MRAYAACAICASTWKVAVITDDILLKLRRLAMLRLDMIVMRMRKLELFAFSPMSAICI